MSIRTRRAALERHEAKTAAALQLLQIECPHPVPFAKYRGSSGNYDPSADSHWIEWRCPDCGKHWQTDQTREAMKMYPNAVRVRT